MAKSVTSSQLKRGFNAFAIEKINPSNPVASNDVPVTLITEIFTFPELIKP